MTDEKQPESNRMWKTIPEAAREIGVNRVTVWRWVKAGKLKSRKTVRYRKYVEEAVSVDAARACRDS